MNPPLTPPRRGTDMAKTDAGSPPGRGRGWVGSWRARGRDSPVPPVIGALSKAHFRQLVLQLHLGLLEIIRRRFVSLFFRRKTKTPELVEIPRCGVTVAERHAAAGHRAGPRNLVHVHFHMSWAGLGQFLLRQRLSGFIARFHSCPQSIGAPF